MSCISFYGWFIFVMGWKEVLKVPIISVSNRINGGRHAPSLEKQTGRSTGRLSIILLRTRAEAKLLLAT